ncbi:MAG: DegV family protein [Fervidobacterium sp.]|nr:DegV family protein [Fervidobacterium sp.]
MYIFITDSGYDLPNDVKLPFELKVLPLRVFLKEKEYEDKVTIDANELYRLELAGELATTSLPKPEVIESTIKESAARSEKVFIITISAKLSNTHDLIKNVLSSLKFNNVEIFDSKTACIKQGYVLLRAMEHVKQTGVLTQRDIDRFVDESLLVFLVPTLDYLYRGGRIGKAKALIGKMLSLKPILTTDNEGEVNTLGTTRSIEAGINTMQNIINKFLEAKNLSNDYSVIGAYTIPETKKYAEKLSEFYKKQLIGLTNIGSAIAAHVGPEAFGLVIGKGVHLD